MNREQKQILLSQLNNERRTIRELKQVYSQALVDVNQKIRELSARTDLENIESIVYQQRYQEALKAQLEGVLSNLQSNEFATLSGYLQNCYTEGFTGVLYELRSQGIPVIFPIDQNQVVKAITTDSKLSKGMYQRLGEDINKLKTSIRAELSRGIANGSTWNEMATKISKSMKHSPLQTAMNNAIRIARTEGHRIQISAARDAQMKAKEAGADVVKQWDATLDGLTREHHRMLDGQIRELDEPFEVDGMQAEAPAHFGIASEDINCRCALLTRARWALDDEFEKMDNFTGESRFFMNSRNYEMFKKDYFSKENIEYMNYFEKLRTKYNEFRYDKLLSAISDREYNLLKYFEGKTPIFNHTESIIPNIVFRDKGKTVLTEKQRYDSMMAVLQATNNLPEKVRRTLGDVTFELGYDGSACDVKNRIIRVSINADVTEMYHEYGHLVEEYMMKKSDVDEYKRKLTKGLKYANIKEESYEDSTGNKHTIFVLEGGNFESEYQTRLYISKKIDGVRMDGTINTDFMWETISEPFMKYMNGESIGESVRILIEGAIL